MMEKKIVDYLNTAAIDVAGAGVTSVVRPFVFSSPSFFTRERVFLGSAFILQFTLYKSTFKKEVNQSCADSGDQYC